MKKESRELIMEPDLADIMAILEKGDSYGYKIVQEIKELNNNKTACREASEYLEATTYTVLRRLEMEKMIRSYWKTDKVNAGERPRKYYALVKKGSTYSRGP